MRLALALPVALALSAALPVSAQDANAWLERAESAEAAADPAGALEAWRHLVEAAPTSRLAGRARVRIAWIEARSEGDYAPLRALMAFLGRAPATRDASVVEAFAAEVEAMPDGLVRPESRLAIAGEWARLGEAERAHAAWQACLDDPLLPPSNEPLVREAMARARVDEGDLAGALGELEDAHLEDLSLHDTTARQLRARTWVPVSYGVLAAFVLAVIAVTVRSRRAGEILKAALAPLRVAIVLLLGAGPWAIVAWWGDDSVDAFAFLAPFACAVLAGCFVAGEATERPAARVAIGALAVAATLAMAYVAVALHGEALPFA